MISSSYHAYLFFLYYRLRGGQIIERVILMRVCDGDGWIDGGKGGGGGRRGRRPVIDGDNKPTRPSSRRVCKAGVFKSIHRQQ